MKGLMKRKEGLIPNLLNDFFTPSPFLVPSLFDVEFDELPARIGLNVPSANIRETEKEFIVELAAPGLSKKDFKVETDNGMLTISAEKEARKEEGKGDYTRKEYSYHSFNRSFTLPENSKPEQINAHYEDGILKIAVPKKEITPLKNKKEIAVS
jgi:HSP20 family protein